MRALARTWALGVGDVPPGIVPYLVHPWVIANDRLRAAGWEPRHTNEQAIREGVATLAATSAGPDPRAVAGVAAGAVVVTLVAYRLTRRRTRR